MPDPPIHAPRVPVTAARARRGGVLAYVELHCKTNFSFLEGASHADELVARAAELGYRGLAITDRHSLAGVVRAHTAAKECGLPLLVGAEITPSDAAGVVLLATDRASYGRLSRLITTGCRRAEKGKCALELADVAAAGEGMIACVAAAEGERFREAKEVAAYREIFGRDCWVMAEFYRGRADGRRREAFEAISRATGIPLVAAGDVHYHAAERQALQHVLTAVREGTTVAEAGELLLPNAERHLQRLENIRETFATMPEAVRRTVEIAERVNFSLDELRYDYPRELVEEGATALASLRRLTWEGAAGRYPDGVPEKVRTLVEHELSLIAELRYEAYFLTIWDVVRYARERGILCQGRGSAANSAVCFCLGITSVDPDRLDVLFERFVSRERDEPPDIDVDFEHERREEVLQYLYTKYGRERAAMTAEVITYRGRSAVRDVGKALGLSLDRIDTLAKNLEVHGEDKKLEDRFRMSGIDPGSRTAGQLATLVGELVGFPRHLSQHVGGMVLTESPLCEIVPVENAAMAERTVIQWNKDDLDALGILKIDCLALGMLTAIRKCFDLIAGQGGERLTLASVPPDDAAVYDMICEADTVGVFQIESRGQMSMLPRLRPRNYYDLVIEVAIVRPGPIQGDMVHPYLRRRNGEEAVEYPSEAIREVLKRTLGVPLFQEQAMQLAVVAAGFTPGEADQLRRAMGAWRRPGIIHEFRTKLLAGMQKSGLDASFAERVYQQIQGFGEYGFPESHAASFALLVYVSAWLKRHHPAAFTAAVINSQPMGFYAPAQLIRDARDHGVEVRGVDVNASDWDCTLEAGAEGEPAVRMGMRMVRGLPTAAGEGIEACRKEDGLYRSPGELGRRCRAAGYRVGRGVLERLAEADAFGSLGTSRREALWQVLDEEQRAVEMPLFAEGDDAEDEAWEAELPAMSAQDEVLEDYATTGLSLRAHPLSFYREQMEALGITPAAGLEQLAHGRPVVVAGLVLLRQRPSTAKGITFVTIEDETGTANLVIHQRTWDRYYAAARRAVILMVRGKVERKDRVIHVVARELADLGGQLKRPRSRSRDFR